MDNDRVRDFRLAIGALAATGAVAAAAVFAEAVDAYEAEHDRSERLARTLERMTTAASVPPAPQVAEREVPGDRIQPASRDYTVSAIEAALEVRDAEAAVERITAAHETIDPEGCEQRKYRLLSAKRRWAAFRDGKFPD